MKRLLVIILCTVSMKKFDVPGYVIPILVGYSSGATLVYAVFGQAAADLERILKAYLSAWEKAKAVLIGYSLGADVLPFMANRLPPGLLDRVELIALLGPDNQVDWEFHLTDWLGGRSRNAVKVLPEVEKLAAKRILCIYGTAETESLCPQMSGDRLRTVAFRGAHHFGGSYEAIARTILDELRK